jgi:SHS2 domain-containing protein
MKKLVLLIALFFIYHNLMLAQTTEQPKEDKGEFSGNFQTNNQFYMRDDRIGASTTQYLREKSSTDAWLFMNYKFKGFNFAMRYDAFNNSPLFNPQAAYSNQGVGFWQVSKDIDKLNVTIGYIYDQFGSGMTFRAYEDRNIGIDFAIQGARVIYNMSDNTRFKAFTGKQKYRFDTREPIIKGINAEHRMALTEKVTADLGASVVNRTLDQTTMNAIASTINSYTDIKDRFDPKYNVYAFQFYNTLSFGNFSWMVEYDYKTEEAIMNEANKLIKSAGHIYFTSLSYSSKGIGINAQFKRIEKFPLRVSPLEISPVPNNAPVNYLPSITRQNTYRLLARYNSVVQELGENAMQLELTLKPSKTTQVNINASMVRTLSGIDFKNMAVKLDTTTRLFREVYIDIQHKFSKTFKAMIGIQSIGYNQATYELKAFAPYVEAITPFGEMTYKLTPTRSFRFEWQYMHTKQDLGSFVNGLLEYNMAPHWSFSAGDMLNFQSGSVNAPAAGETFELVHYFNLFAAYTYKTSRFSAGFLKQPQGVNCTGGVCRVEPAFSGARVSLTTNF